MMKIRKAGEHGPTRLDWLDSRHTFSFGNYHDSRHMGFGPLRVINEDRVVPGAGFATHGHRDMEIISYVLDGALEHKDSLGNGSVILPGHVQRMSAGTGIRHSEFNHSPAEPVHFLQIWILPEKEGLAPGYEQMKFLPDETRNRLKLVASRDGRDGSVTIHQDVDLYVGSFYPGEEAVFQARADRKVWLQIARGEIDLEGSTLGPGDGAALEDVADIRIYGRESAEILLFDMTP